MKRTAILISSVIFLLTAVSCGTDNRVNVLIVLLDTSRADHFSCYGYRRNTTPAFDSLAAAGTLALQCQSQSSWTLPAMTTILSGVTVAEHGAGRSNGEFRGISPELPWLPLAFHREGYRTSAFFNVMFMNEDFGFHRGFQHFDCRGVASGNSLRKAGPTVDDFLQWLDTSPGNQPFFAAVHFYDPHIPYRAPEPYRSMYVDSEYTGEYGDHWGEDVANMLKINSGEVVPSDEDMYNLAALYDGELTYTDSEAGRLFAEIRDRGLADNTIIVVVGDHGEEFFEHGGIEHGRTLYQELTHVPLILAGPGFNGGNIITAPAAQLDIAATLAAAAGIQYTTLQPAHDLAADLSEPRDIPASGVLWTDHGEQVSIVNGSEKIIWSVENDSVEGFNLEADPLELHSIQPEERLLDAAGYYWATPPLAVAPVVDTDETATRELRNLGYIR